MTAANATPRKAYPYPGSAQLVSQGGANLRELAERGDALQEGHGDVMAAGVVKLSDWKGLMELPSVNAATGVVKTPKAAGGVAWLAATVGAEATRIRTVTPAKVQEAKPSALPATGKYLCCAWEIEAPDGLWNQPAAVFAHSGPEASAEVEVVGKPPSPAAGRLQLSNFVIRNNAGSYQVSGAKRQAGFAQPLGGTSLLAEELYKVSGLQMDAPQVPPFPSFVIVTVGMPAAANQSATVRVRLVGGGTIDEQGLAPAEEWADYVTVGFFLAAGSWEAELVSGVGGQTLEATYIPI